jgi:hypothetical protein
MLQFTRAGIDRAARSEFRADFFDRIQGIETDDEVVSMILYVVRILTDTENDSSVTDKEVLRFANEHREELLEFCEAIARTRHSFMRWTPLN